MINFDKTIFKSILETRQSNYLFFDIWIYKYEKLYVKGQHYLKLYLYNNNKEVRNIQSVNFSITLKDKEDIVTCLKFQPISAVLDNRGFGCILPLSEDQYENFIKVGVTSYHTTTKRIEAKGYEGVIRLTPLQLENEKNSYLKSKIDNYKMFVNIEKEYWQCSCGAINKINSTHCYNCQSEYLKISEFYHTSLDRLFLNYYLMDYPFNVDAKISLSDNIDKYFIKLAAYNISKDLLKESLDYDKIYKTYVSENKLRLDLNLSSEENIKNHFNKLKDLGLDLEKIDQSQFDYVESDLASLKSRKHNLKKYGISAVLLVVLVIGAVKIYPYGRYALAVNALKKGNYEVSEKRFTDLDDLLNSKEYVLESRYLYAKQIAKDDYLLALELMSDLKDYKDAMDYRYNYQYLAAKELSKTDLQEAGRLMTEIRNYKDAKDLGLAYKYDYVTSLIKDKNYTKALDELNDLGFYKDSKKLKEDLLEKLGDEAVGSKNYKKAIDYYQKMADKSKFKDVSYTYASKLYKEKKYKEARNVFYKISDFKDSKSKIDEIENVVYKWQVDMAINNVDHGMMHDAGVGLYEKTPIYLHAKVTNGPPSKKIVLRFVVSWPTGTNDDFKSEALAVGSWFQSSNQWHDVHTIPKGEIVFKVYNAETNELLGTKTSLMR